MKSNNSPIKEVIIIGAGAAGLMCAIEAAKRGRSVLVLEHNSAVGKKIRISGGGRCNFTNIHTKPDNYLSLNEHFAKSALARFTPEDFVAIINKYKIPYHEKKLGQLFCDESSQNIIDLLKKECGLYKAQILLECRVTEITKNKFFHLTTTQGEFQCESLVIATGGLSIPTLGVTDLGYKVAEQFDIKINPCRPGLVPLTFKEKDVQIFKELSGVALDTIVSFGKISFRENTLFTHKGLSGPAVLQISSYWEPRKPIHINFVPEKDMASVLKSHQAEKITLRNFLKDYLPSRLTEILCLRFFENKPLHDYSLERLEKIGKELNGWEFIPQGTEGYAKAEVTVGGIDTNELSSKTMESKRVPGLYFIGEIVDVTGHLGGFNFQWAWGSGFAAGQYA
ncbi:MAG: NAD(P)/FAD-dependent oxidoreductase [Candidatus Omnitrophica bacterium]|nr:NAD(P)/FAD-dependent oxidoreductase [Candidatus Omnitrophota bacterium]